MFPLRRLLPIYCLFLIASQTTFAQSQVKQSYHIEHITSDGGLPANTVFAIHQDDFGFLWLGTDRGLVRYDGALFESYTHIEGDSTSLAGREIVSIQEDAQGNFWLGTDQGISYFDRQAERFENYSNPPSYAILLSPSDPEILWVADVGLSKFHLTTRHFEVVISHEDYDTNSLFRNWTGYHGLVEDEEGIVWAGGLWGLFRYDTDSKALQRHFPDSRYPDVTPETWFPGKRNATGSLMITSDEQDVLWGAARGGMFKLDRIDLSIDIIPYGPQSEDLADELPRGQQITAFHSGRSGIFWAAMRNGLYTFDRKTRQFTFITETHFDFPVIAIFEDLNGTVWLGASDGLRKVSNTPYPFVSYWNPDNPDSSFLNARRGISADEMGRVLLKTDAGLVAIDSDHLNTYDIVESRHTGGNEFSVSTMHLDSRGNLWVGRSNNEIDVFDPNLELLHSFRHSEDDPHSIENGIFNHIAEDEDGFIWVAVFPHKVDRYDPETGKFTHYRLESANRTEGIIRFYRPLSEPHTLWIANLAGPARLGLETEQFTYYYMDELSLTRAMLEDGKQRFWIVSEHGLHLFDRDTGKFETLTEQDGLANNKVMSIVEDDQGFLWLGTDNGLSRFDPETHSFKNFTVRDGLPSNRFEESGFFKAESGALFFMTRGGAGWFSFHPHELNEGRGAVSMVLTQLDIKGEPAGVDTMSPLDRAVLFTDDVMLSHEQNELTIHYAGLNALNPERVEYQYMLEGFDADWVRGGTQRFVRYNQLPPGDYTFLVRGSETGVDWSPPRALGVEILPPWWRTTWAYVGYGLLLIGGIVVVDRVQRRRLLGRAQREAEIREVELKAQAAEALSREATAMARESEAQARALEEENRRKQVELEKAEELRQAHAALETSYEDLQQTHTRLQQTQEQLIHAEKMASLGQLTAGIAHEIKNPLNFVNNFSRLSLGMMEELVDWMREHAGEEELEVFETLMSNAEKIAHHGQRADSIVMAMIEHSRTGPGERRPVDLNQVLDEHVQLAYHGMQARDEGFTVELDCDYDEAIGVVDVVPQELGRVFINLLNNAFDAVKEKWSTGALEDGSGPRIDVHTKIEGDEVVIRISDNGVGVTPQVRDKIFQPFFTTKPAGSGSTGLGLSLSHDIVVQGHGGSLALECEEGTGAVFIIKLPV